MYKVRKGVFETNSSSTHSIAISKGNYNLPKFVRFEMGEFGGEKETRTDTANYLYSALVTLDRYDDIEKLKSILDAHGIEYEFGRIMGDNDFPIGWVDHASGCQDLIQALFADEDLLFRFLFGDSKIYTDYDNTAEDDDMCYCALERIYDWENETYYDNPNHDKENYDYFYKGN